MFAPSLNLNLGRQEEMLNITNLNTVVVHSGTFHLDDVLFVAMAQLARTFNSLPLLTVVRSNRVQPEWTLENGYLVGDVGNGQYDHHDATPKLRENGEPYAAAGLLFRDLWQSLGLSESAFLTIDKEFIAPSDLHDCTGCGNDLARLIKALNPNWDEPSSPDAINSQFGKAVDIVITLLDAHIERIREEFDDRITHCQDTGTSMRDYEQGLLGLLEEFNDNYQSHFVDKLASIIAESEKYQR